MSIIKPLKIFVKILNATKNTKLKNNPISKNPTEPGRNGKPKIPYIKVETVAAIKNVNSVCAQASA